MDAELLSLFEDALERFNRERYAPARLLQRIQAGDDAAAAQLAEMADLGWFDLLNDDDGQPARTVTRLLPLFRAAGEGLWQEPLGALLGAGAVIASRAESATLRTALIDGLISGRQPLAYATRERGDGWSTCAVRTTATTRNGRTRLQGEKIAIPDAALCAGAVVLARDGGTGQTGFYRVARDAAGAAWHGVRGIDGRGLADLRLNDTEADYLCSGEHAAAADAWATILDAAEAVGVMRGANRDTVAYLRERRQFGRPLLEFQALQHRLVDTHLLERETDALLLAVAEAHDDGAADLPRRLLALRAQAAQALRQVAAEAVQLHGGMGVTQETRVSHAYRRALMLDSLHGSAAWALDALAAEPSERIGPAS